MQTSRSPRGQPPLRDGMRQPDARRPRGELKLPAIVATKNLVRSKRRRQKTVNRSPMLYQYVVGKGAPPPPTRVSTSALV